MSSHESIRPEASTIHRGAGSEPSGDVESASATGDQQLVQAKTVIRGSSRAVAVGGRLDKFDRTPASVTKVLLGKRLNHFFFEELIGGGGMGAVFRARDEQLDRVVAIKVIPFVGEDPDLQRRFRNEAQNAAKLDHPRIARVFDVGSQGEWHYIVFEYIHGVNIRDRVLSSGVLPMDDAVYYTCQLAAALQHAADRGIVHRDIKPSNVLIGEEDEIKLVDMGLARSDNLELSEDMTASGVTLGTFDYISPEQARDPRDADLRSDIYSLGCTLYFMLTGHPPYPGGTMLQKLLSHGNAPPPDARELRPEVSGELMAVIRKMLAKSPDDRYQIADDLIADLREVAFRDGLTRTQAIGPVAIREPNLVLVWLEQHAPWLVAVSLLIVIAGWLHLDSVASREELAIPPSASPPVTVTRPAIGTRGGADSASRTERRAVADSAAVRAQGVASNGDADVSEAGTDDGLASDRPQLQGVTLPTDRKPPGEAAVEREPDDAAVLSAQDSSPIDPLGAGQPPALIRVTGVSVPVENDRDIDGAMLVSSFVNAVALAERYEVDHIEIAAPIIYSESVEINRDSLRITSDVAGGSVILFQPQESITMERSNMIDIGSNRIEFEDLHFVWKLPGGEINGGAMFAINDNPSVRLTDCSVTIENPGLCEEVYAFDVVTDPEQLGRSRRRDPRGSDSLPLVAVELNNVIVRGQMTMIHMDYAAELQLNWDNGLLAISDHMIDTAGARIAPSPIARPIQVWLTRLTAYTPKGLLRMRLGVSGNHPVSVDRVARSSVFMVDPGVPHFEFLGLESLSDDRSWLKLRGTANAYDTDPTLADPILVETSEAGETEMVRLHSLAARWPDELSPQWSVHWLQQGAGVRFSDATPSSLTPDDFRQDGALRSGFNAGALPILPVFERVSVGAAASRQID